MANTDKKQAALDAIQDIIKARLASKMGGMSGGPGGEIDMDIDPDLNTPQAQGMQQPPSNIEINDPDGVLDQQKQNHPQKKQGGSQGQQSQQSQQSNGQQSGESSGESDESGEAGEQQGQQSKGQSGQQSSGKSNKGSAGGEEDKKGLSQDDIDNLGKQETGKPSDDFVKDWNEAMDKFDKDDVSDEDLEKALTDKNTNETAKKAIKLIQDSRDRQLEIDPSVDKRLKMPKNSKVKEYEDSDDESDEDRQKRVTKIQKSFDDTDAVDQDINDIEADIAIKKADAMQAKQQELDRIARKGQLLDFSEFSNDLFNAIKTQIGDSREPEDSFLKPNASYANSDVIMPSQIYDERPEIPTVNVYFDQSGSWGPGDIKKGIDALASIKDFEYQNRVRVNLYYFADHLHDTEKYNGWNEGGTGGFDEVIQNIRDTGATNVLVMTDDDIEYQTNWKNVPVTEVDGCVWYVWRYGSRSHQAPKHLFGAEGTFQYSLK